VRRVASESITALRQRLIIDMLLAPSDGETCQLRSRVIEAMFLVDPALEKWFKGLLKVYA